MKLSVRQGLKKMSRNIVQINNRFIQDENQRRRYLDEERRKRNRFMGWVLILVMLVFHPKKIKISLYFEVNFP